MSEDNANMDRRKRRNIWLSLLAAAAVMLSISSVGEAVNRPVRYYTDDNYTAMTYYTDALDGNGTLSRWGINTDDPQCELDVNGTICINRTGVYYEGINVSGGDSRVVDFSGVNGSTNQNISINLSNGTSFAVTVDKDINTQWVVNGSLFYNNSGVLSALQGDWESFLSGIDTDINTQWSLNGSVLQNSSGDLSLVEAGLEAMLSDLDTQGVNGSVTTNANSTAGYLPFFSNTTLLGQTRVYWDGTSSLYVYNSSGTLIQISPQGIEVNVPVNISFNGTTRLQMNTSCTTIFGSAGSSRLEACD